MIVIDLKIMTLMAVRILQTSFSVAEVFDTAILLSLFYVSGKKVHAEPCCIGSRLRAEDANLKLSRLFLIR